MSVLHFDQLPEGQHIEISTPNGPVTMRGGADLGPKQGEILGEMRAEIERLREEVAALRKRLP